MDKNFETRDVTQAKPNMRITVESWWCCVDGDPTKALFYTPYNSPQYNKQEHITKHLIEKMFEPEDNVQATYIPTAFYYDD